MEIYLDNSATTKVYDDVADICIKAMTEDYGNASSMHHKGVEAEQYLKEATEKIAKTLKAKPKEILFTSGGTESDNIAIIGGAYAHHREGKHLITTSIEHPAILNSMKHLEEQGFEVTYLKVSEEGVIDLEELKNSIREDTILVSIMAVNNEIGSLMPLKEAGTIIHGINPRILFHVDAVQGYGKLSIIPKQLGIDLMSVSGHKVHGPKGIGFLYIRDCVRILPISYGGGQQGGMRSGTLNIPGIAGLGRASEEIYEDFDEKTNRLYSLKSRLIKGLLSNLSDVRINGIDTSKRSISSLSDEELGDIISKTAPHIISVSVKGVRAEVLLHALEDKKIYVSAGSACSSNHPSISATLKAINLPKEFWDSTVRISMSEFTTEQEIDDTVKAFADIVPMLRQFSRR
ncbi:cysteine desulfurase family protein [Butyrivibrio sp. LC3010]|uniref:cysteine desulfurase family protein n=1 Tax=Butyrivibrio sp. LC3010 TaxID=1280680 RepID=UPI000402A4D3|nr:cysteine desulfurase family protein [Butyrivibrio sp. LC3010]